jgi:hypothetical protein
VLRELGVAEQLPEGWRDTVSRDSLGDLEKLTRRYWIA